MNLLKVFKNKKVGLALGSGSAKGLSHIAVIQYLETLGIPIDMIAGSSIGALIGALHCVGSLKRFTSDTIKMKRMELFALFDPVIPTSGLMRGEKIFEFLKKYIPADTNIEDLETPLRIVATDFNSGRAVVFQRGRLLDAIRASVSIPGIFVPAKYKGTFLIDGGVANPLPINIVKRMGAGLTIAVNLHPRLVNDQWDDLVNSRIPMNRMTIDSSDIEIVKEVKNAVVPIKKSEGMGYLKAVEKWLGINLNKEQTTIKTPNIFETITQAIDIMEYMNTRLMLKHNPPTVLIEPDVRDISILDFTEIETVMNEGFRACKAVDFKLKSKIKMWL